MRLITRFLLPLTALYLLFFSFGCDDATSGVGGVVLGPEVSLASGAGIIDADTDLDLAAASFTVSIRANDGDAPLSSLTIQENGTNIPTARLTFLNGLTAQNPILIPGADAGGFTYDVQISGNNGMTGPSTYTFLVTDQDQESDFETLTINFTQPTPMVELLIADSLVSGDATINSIGGVFDVRINLTTPGPLLREFAVLEDGELMDASELSILNQGGMTSNPITLATEEGMGTMFGMTIDPDDTEDGTRVYTFRATDANGVSGETSINLTFEAPPGTPIAFDTTGVFFNASGPYERWLGPR